MLHVHASSRVFFPRENVLKFVNRYGTPVSFRFFFKAGTDVMEPRGYCFVEYSTREVGFPVLLELCRILHS